MEAEAIQAVAVDTLEAAVEDGNPAEVGISFQFCYIFNLRIKESTISWHPESKFSVRLRRRSVTSSLRVTEGLLTKIIIRIMYQNS